MGKPDGESDGGAQRPLFVDLDGSLIATDSLWESALQLLRTKPWALLLAPSWLFNGRARLKSEINARTAFDPTLLPYRQSIIDFIQQAKQQGRQIYLATAADSGTADRVATHLAIFDGVIASDGEHNIKGEAKLAAIREIVGDGPFDYLGDSKADLPIWHAAGRALVVQPSVPLRHAIVANSPIEAEFEPDRAGLLDVLKAMRVHQWVKNILLFVPLLLAHQFTDLQALGRSVVAFMAFCCCTSSIYVLNDLLDLPSDRQHPQKRQRPFAAGTLAIPFGLTMIPLLFGLGIALSLLLPLWFSAMLVGYVLLTTVYSVYLKRKLMADVMMLGGFYAYRVLAGAVAISVMLSPWLLAFSIFFFLSLGFVKRYADISEAKAQGTEGRLAGRGYFTGDLDMIRVVGPSAGYMSVLVLALYINSIEVTNFYRHPYWLWLICVCLLYWLSRVWFLAHRGEMPHDPVLFALRDRTSYGVGAAMLLSIGLASV